MNGLCMPVAIQNDCIIFGLQYETASIRMREKEREREQWKRRVIVLCLIRGIWQMAFYRKMNIHKVKGDSNAFYEM